MKDSESMYVVCSKVVIKSGGTHAHALMNMTNNFSSETPTHFF